MPATRPRRAARPTPNLLRHHAGQRRPGDFYDTAAGGVEFSTGGAAPGTDLDLYVYESDAAGNVGDFVGASGGGDATWSASSVIGATRLLPRGRRLLQRDTNTDYAGRAEFFRRNKFPADVDNPPGLQDTLVSDPALGFRSHSEPHLSQDPTNPNVLVGGSKMYNRDPDSLAEYEFKIGTYASFDRGRQLVRPRPAEHLPAEPGAAVVVAARQHAATRPTTRPRRHRAGGRGRPAADGDFGEEYITSDVWTDFDDEGNAYAMVLDSPPFPSGNGWGMSLHRWETPSLRDIRRGRTWSSRIIIDATRPSRTSPTTLDDKNTFAVNNAGPRPRRQDRHHGRLLGPELRPRPGGAPADRVRALRRRRAHWPDPPQADLPAAEPAARRSGRSSSACTSSRRA